MYNYNYIMTDLCSLDCELKKMCLIRYDAIREYVIWMTDLWRLDIFKRQQVNIRNSKATVGTEWDSAARTQVLSFWFFLYDEHGSMFFQKRWAFMCLFFMN